MTTVLLRYRLVTAQDGREHVSSIVLSEDEAQESLDLEAHIHEAFGWHVDRYQGAGGYLVAVRCRRGDVARHVYARAFSPMTDTPEGGDER